MPLCFPLSNSALTLLQTMPPPDSLGPPRTPFTCQWAPLWGRRAPMESVAWLIRAGPTGTVDRSGVMHILPKFNHFWNKSMA